MKRKVYLSILCLLLTISGGFTQTSKIKVACVGNSITGFHQYTYYATPLQHMLGDTYHVDNFGKGGSGIFKEFREALNEHEFAYINSTQCAEAVAFNPNIVIIKFGANDANMNNFTRPGIDGKQIFKDDYTLLINKFKALSSKPKIYICLPPAMFYPEGQIKDSLTGNFLGGFSSEAMHKYIRPAVKELATELNLGLIDFYTPTKLHPEFMPGNTGGWAPDWVHPDHRGHYVMAVAAYEAIMGKPFERPAVEGEFVPDPAKEYYIRNRKTGEVLTCNSTEVNQGVLLKPLDVKSQFQLFKFENFSYNIFRIRHLASNLQLKNAGSQVLIGNDPVNEPLKYGFYIKPVEEKYHTICYNDLSFFGARTSSASIAGNRQLSNLSELDQWEFVEKEKISETAVSEIYLSDIKIKGMKGQIQIESINDNNMTVYDALGKQIKQFEVNTTPYTINLQSGVYIVSMNCSKKRSYKVIVN